MALSLTYVHIPLTVSSRLSAFSLLVPSCSGTLKGLNVVFAASESARARSALVLPACAGLWRLPANFLDAFMIK